TVAVLEERDQVLPREAEHLAQSRRRRLTSAFHALLERLEELPEGVRRVVASVFHLHDAMLTLEMLQQRGRVGSEPVLQLDYRRRLMSRRSKRRDEVVGGLALRIRQLATAPGEAKRGARRVDLLRGSEVADERVEKRAVDRQPRPDVLARRPRIERTRVVMRAHQRDDALSQLIEHVVREPAIPDAGQLLLPCGERSRATRRDANAHRDRGIGQAMRAALP